MTGSRHDRPPHSVAILRSASAALGVALSVAGCTAHDPTAMIGAPTTTR